jgi:hypothetical protein
MFRMLQTSQKLVPYFLEFQAAELLEQFHALKSGAPTIKHVWAYRSRKRKLEIIHRERF